MVTTADVKFSQFTTGGDTKVSDYVVGLRAGENEKFDFPGTGFKDINGNYLLKYSTAGASAVNCLALVNSITTLPVIITVNGSDANIGIHLLPKGSGALKLNTLNWVTSDGTNGQVISTNGAGVLGWSTVSSFSGVSTDNAIVRFDGVAGVLQNSGIIIDNSNNVSGFASVVVNGSTSGTMTLLATAIAGSNTITFPAATGTVALTSGIPALPLSLSNGGTGASLVADNGAIAYSNATTLALLASTPTAGKVLQSGSSSAPSWSTSTYPSGSGTLGKILRSDGTNNIYSTSTFADTYAVSTILYAASADVVSGLATAVNGVLITSAGGVPSISSTLPNAVQDNITRLGTVTVGTWNSSVIGGTYGGTGVNNGASTITVPANFAIVGGAFTFDGALTANTAVTFPTSGTLATTSQLATPAALTKADDTNVTLTLGGTPATALLQATSLTLGWAGQLSVARGGTSVSSVTIAPTATAFAGWDANSNLTANSMISGFATTATAAGTTVLTVASKRTQEFTGATTQTVEMPVTSTLVAGQQYYIMNNSNSNVTINSSGGNAIQILAANTSALLTCVLNSGTTAASWNASYIFDAGGGVQSITGTTNQIVASASTGAITLSLPQNIATSSSPTFSTLTSSVGVIVGGNATASGTVVFLEDTDNGSNKVTLTPAQSLAADYVLTLPSATDTLVGKATTDILTNKTLTNPTITNYTETVNTPTVTAGAVTIDLANGTIQVVVTAANTTITLPAASAGKSYIIQVSYGGTHTITWAGGSTIKWATGIAPVATSVSGKFDTYCFYCTNGTNTFGTDGGRNA